MKKLQWIMMGLIVLLVMQGAIAQGSSSSDDEAIMLTSSDINGEDQGNDQILLTNLLSTLEEYFDVTFLYKDEMMVNKYVPKDNIRIDKKTGQELSEILAQLGMTFQRIDEQTYVLLNKDVSLQTAQVQEGISGTVTDAQSGETLPGVNVIVKGTTMGTSTDSEGGFELTVESLQDTLIFSFVGYQSQELPINGRTEIDVALQSQAIAGEELIVVGYGEQSRKDISASISRVDSEELSQVVSNDFASSIQGRIPGVNVTGNSGAPGAGNSVRIRGVGTTGNNEPLYVVDGFPMTSGEISIPGSPDNISGLSAINSNDIESIEILKDAAAAAIYGARAANGVVLITTKGGSQDSRTSVTLDTYTGFSQPWNLPESLTAEEFAILANELAENSGYEPYEAFQNPQELGKGTDWMDAVYRNAPVKNIDFAVSGGGERTRARLSIGYLNQLGTVIETDYSRYTGRVSFDFIPNEKMEIGGSINLGVNEGTGVQNEAHNFGITNLARKMPPNLELNDVLSNDTPYVTSQADNPVLRAKTQDRSVKNIKTNIKTHVQYKIFDNLSMRTNIGIEFNNNQQRRFDPTYNRGHARNTEANLYENWSRGDNYLIENTLSYDKDFLNLHDISLVIGQSAQENNSKYNNTQGRGYLNEQIKVINGSDASRRLASGSKSKYRLASYFGRINYNYNERYLLSASLRRDGSSNFGPENKWGMFPSISIGWNVKDENFMQNFSYLSNLKLRGSWGQLGNDNIYQFAYLNTLSLGSSSDNYTLGTDQSLVTGATINRPANPNLKWETSEEINMAIDASFFDYRLYTTIEYYIKNTKDILLTLPVSYEVGFSNPPSINAGEVLNKGLEFDIGFRGQFGDINWNISGNLSTLYNEVVSLGQGRPIVGRTMYSSGMDMTYTEVGDEIGYFKGYVNDGIYQSEDEIDSNFQPNADPGDLRWRDVNGDGVLDNNDEVKLGSPWPDLTYGGNIELDYKSFDFNLVLSGEAGFQIFNLTKREWLSINYPGGAGIMSGSREALKRWTPGCECNEVPRLIQDDNNVNYNSSSSWLIEDGDYMRIRSFTLGYTLPQKLLERINASNIRIYLNAKNMFTFTKYSGMDPEVRRRNPIASGFDNGQYPQPRTFMVGLNLTF